jgi:hypothetical protein
MVVGVLLLVLQHVLHFTFINELLLLSLLLIIVGLVWHVWMMKREGRY